MLGYSSGKATMRSQFGRVSNTFKMDDVQCTGNEASLLDCPHRTMDDCGPHEGAGVICSELSECGPITTKDEKGPFYEDNAPNSEKLAPASELNNPELAVILKGQMQKEDTNSKPPFRAYTREDPSFTITTR